MRAGFTPVVVTLVAVGAAAAGAALVALAVVLLGLMPTDGAWSADTGPVFPAGLAGEPLADLTADGSIATSAGSQATAGDPADIVVDVAGAVARPGLQRLPAGARVGDAIEGAGGYAPRVDLAEAARTLNLALPLTDGGKILVPELGVAQPQAGGASGDGRIDLNSADQARLESLPGIGPVTAGKIIVAREEARFGSVQDLRDRGIVGESVFEQIRELVSAG